MSSVEEASPSRNLDDDGVVLHHEKYVFVDGDCYPRWSSGDDTTLDSEETTLAPAVDYVLELLWNSRRNRGALEKTEKGPTTIEIESAEDRTFRGTWGHSPGQLSSLVRSVAVAKRNRRALRQCQRLRYWCDASSVDCASKILLELGRRLRGSLVSIALALDRADRGELREMRSFRATTLRIENGSSTRSRYYGNDEVSPKMDSVVPQPKRRNEKPVQAKKSTRIERFGVCSRSLIRKLRKRISMIALKQIDKTMRASVVCKETALCTTVRSLV
ncbi:hypothetical protein TKK_0003958 [Trichogramma kaykai]